MNIMELGAIGELVGGEVAVIASLVYVGLHRVIPGFAERVWVHSSALAATKQDQRIQEFGREWIKASSAFSSVAKTSYGWTTGLWPRA